MEDSVSNSEDKKHDAEIIHVTKSVELSNDLPTFDQEFYQWKKNYWKEKIKDIKYVVAPMVDQRFFIFFC